MAQGTLFSTVIVEAVTVYLNDDRLLDDLGTNPALLLRKMTGYLKSGVARFNKPPEMLDYLAYTDAQFGDYRVTLENDLPAGSPLSTEKTGFELCNVTVCTVDKFGDPVFSPQPSATYDPETGDITFQSDVAAGTTLDVDFYTDGFFKNTLDDTQMRLLCLCIQIVWEFRFANNWLNRQPKVRDRDFSPVSEASTTRSDTERYREWNIRLNDELEAYAQNVFYKAVMPPSFRKL